MRHLYAIVLYDNIVPLSVIQKLLGHQSLEITKIYLDIEEEKIQTSNALYNPIVTYK